MVAAREADEQASPAELVLGIEPATEDDPGGFPYLIRQDRELMPGGSLLHLAIGIQRLADGRLMTAAPDLAAAVRRLLACPDLNRGNLEPETLAAADQAAAALVRSGFR